MNIFYTKTSMWEYDFFKNDIFKNNLYNLKVNFILFDNNTKFINNDKQNIIVSNHGINLNFLENVIKKLKPFVIFHLSDEFGNDIEYYNLYSKYNIKLLFHQYNFEKLDYKMNHFQLPLGYVSGFLCNNSYIDTKKKQYNKKYDFSFVGTLKNDRPDMLNKFSNTFKKAFIYVGLTNWGNPENQNIKPHVLFNIYKDTLFVPIGRGNKSLDCFRLYEAIVAEAIPVICGTIKEISVSFDFSKKMPNIIIADTWDEAIILCKKLYNDKKRICDIINYNNKWFQDQIINISDKIIKLL